MGRAESTIEKYAVKKGEDLGAEVRKVVYQGRKGSPDRWFFFTEGRILIIELKRPGEKPEPIQKFEMNTLRDLGFYVAWTDSKEGVDKVFDKFFNATRLSFNEAFPI